MVIKLSILMCAKKLETWFNLPHQGRLSGTNLWSELYEYISGDDHEYSFIVTSVLAF